MRFEEFEARAHEMWEEIPAEFKQGIDGLIVERNARPHPSIRDVYTLGECLTESYLSDYGGPDTIRSAVVLYYGSFWRLSRLDPEFDWESELWETLTHELQHHLESLASEDDLIGVDYAADENFKRREGEPFDPLFFRSGERLEDSPGEGVSAGYRVEREVFLEIEYPASREPDAWVTFEWEGRQYRVRRPSRIGDVCFIEVEGVESEDDVTLVLVRRRGLGASLRAWFTGRGPEVVEVVREAEVVEEA